MKYIIALVVALVYGVGILTVKALDKVLPENLRNSRSHYPTLLIMWVLTPVLLLLFIGYKFKSTIYKMNRGS